MYLTNNNINSFSKKFLFGESGSYWPKNVAPSYFINRLTPNFDSSNVDMHEWKEKDLLIGSQKKSFFWVNGWFQTQKWHVFIILDLHYGIFKNFFNERGQELHEHYINSLDKNNDIFYKTFQSYYDLFQVNLLVKN